MQIFSNIRSRLFAALLAGSLLPMLIISAVALKNYSELLDYQSITFSDAVVQNAKARMDATLTEIHRVAQTLVYPETSAGNSVLSILRKQSQTPLEYNTQLLEDSRRIEFMISSILYSHDYIDGIFIFTQNGGVFSFSKNATLRYNYKPQNDAWFRKTLDAKGKILASDMEPHDFFLTAEPSIFFSTVIFDPDSFQTEGVILINCNAGFFSSLSRNSIPDQGTLSLLNTQGRYVYHPQKDQAGQMTDATTLGRIRDARQGVFTNTATTAYTVFDTLEQEDWKMVVSFPAKALGSTFRKTLSFSVILTLACILLALLVSGFFASNFSKPIKKLALRMKHWEDVSDTAPDPLYLRRRDEIGMLHRYFAQMVSRINTMIRDKYQTQLIVLDAEMKALESQINSHFLYNTLEAINSIAEIEGVPKIAVMTKSLGDMFRYCIKTESELVPLESELNHIRDYLIIQNIRYSNRFQCVFEVPPELIQLPILKLILQPIVENAVHHGLEQKKGAGKLTVRVWRTNQQLWFEIEDNGIGMSEVQLENLSASLREPPQFEKLGRRDKRGIGLTNVHTRIRLYYGAAFGLTVSSQDGTGTTIRVCIPETREG